MVNFPSLCKGLRLSVGPVFPANRTRIGWSWSRDLGTGRREVEPRVEEELAGRREKERVMMILALLCEI